MKPQWRRHYRLAQTRGDSLLAPQTTGFGPRGRLALPEPRCLRRAHLANGQTAWWRSRLHEFRGPRRERRVARL